MPRTRRLKILGSAAKTGTAMLGPVEVLLTTATLAAGSDTSKGT